MALHAPFGQLLRLSPLRRALQVNNSLLRTYFPVFRWASGFPCTWLYTWAQIVHHGLCCKDTTALAPQIHSSPSGQGRERPPEESGIRVPCSLNPSARTPWSQQERRITNKDEVFTFQGEIGTILGFPFLSHSKVAPSLSFILCIHVRSLALTKFKFF